MEQGIIFAEAGTNSDIITWGIILTLTTVAANIVAVVLAFSNRKQKREVSFGFVPASKDEFDKHVEENKSEHDNIFHKLGGVERGLRGEFNNEIRIVRAEMTQTTAALASLRTSAEMLNQSLVGEKARLDRTIERDRS